MNKPLDPNDPTPVSRETPRSAQFMQPSRRWPGLVAVGALTAVIAAIAVSSFYDRRSVGEKVDATVEATAQKVQDSVDGLRLSASAAARNGAQAGARVASAINDTGITAAVKTSLAADPRLSALKIDVDTENGVVSLIGPAPDDGSRERAAVLAAAPHGVLRVDNRLVVSPAPEKPLTR